MSSRATHDGEPGEVGRARAWWRWPAIVVGLLGFSVATQAVLLCAALADPGFRLEQDYYRHAVDWDRERAQEEAAAAAGWTLSVSAAPGPGSSTRVEARLQVAGQPVRDAEVRVLAFHPAHKHETVQGRLNAGSDGVYAGDLPLGRAGRWVVRVEAGRGGLVLRQELKASVAEGAR